MNKDTQEERIAEIRKRVDSMLKVDDQTRLLILVRASLTEDIPYLLTLLSERDREIEGLSHEVRGLSLTAQIAEAHIDAIGKRYDALKIVSQKALEFMSYLISHLPEDERDNKVWMALYEELKKEPQADLSKIEASPPQSSL